MARKFLLSLTRNQQLPFDYNIDYETAMDSLGGNSGNNIFQYSLQSMLRANDIDVEKSAGRT